MTGELDAETRAMAVAGASRWASPVSEPSVAAARAAYTERYRVRCLPPNDEVHVHSIVIPSAGGDIPARLYRPRALAGRAPLIVYFHGGGFVLGDAGGYELQSMRLAEAIGAVLLFPEFRLAPEHPFPAAVEDSIAAVEWAARNAAALDVDTNRIVVMGDSAGGNLVANVCLHARERGFPRIDLQCLLYPVTDFRPYCGGESYPSVELFSKGFLLDREVMEWFALHYLPEAGDAVDPRASPLLAPDLTRLPPALVVTAECDPLRDMGAAFATALTRAGVPVEYQNMAGLAHNFLGHIACSSRARDAFDTVVEAVTTHLRR